MTCIAAVYGQNRENSESRLEFQAGGKDFLRFPDNTFINRFYNGVRTSHLDAVLTAEEGVYESGPGRVRFFGKAAFVDTLRRLYADTLVYFEQTREAYAVGNVRMYQGDRSVFADSIYYNKDMRYVRASGSVSVNDDSTHTAMSGATAEFSDSTGYGRITGTPFIERIEEDGTIMTVTCTDTLEIIEDERILRLWNNVVAVMDSIHLSCADTLEIHDTDKTVRLWRDVLAVRDSLTAEADMAVYDDAAGMLHLTGNPRIRYGITDTRDDAPSTLHTVSVVTGDKVDVIIRDRAIAGASITGKATSVTSSIDSTGVLFDRSIVESSGMVLEMASGVISRITAGGTAQSYYHRHFADEGRMFINEASGDTLTFFFDGGKIREMVIFGYGGGLGKGSYFDYDAVGDTSRVKVKPVSDASAPGN